MSQLLTNQPAHSAKRPIIKPALWGCALGSTLFSAAGFAQAVPADPAPAVALATAAAEPPTRATWTVEGTASISSDYRFRGVSLSNHGPQISAAVTIGHGSGAYANVWLSSLQLDEGAVDAETDVALGWRKQWAGLELDFGSAYYLYPAKPRFNYAEFHAKASRQLGAYTLGVAANYAPRQSNIGDTDNLYLSGFAEGPITATPITAHAALGIENGAFGQHKLDWQVGLRYDLGAGLSATVDYIDTARAHTPLADASVVAALSWDF